MKWLKRSLALVLCGVWLIVPVAAEAGMPVWITDTESGEATEELVWEDRSLWQATDVPVSENPALEIGGKSALLMEMETGTVLYKKDPETPLPIASVTKIMTLLLIMEAIDTGALHYDDMLTCSEAAAGMGGSQIWLEPGETMTVDDLLKAVTVVSANDACAVFAEHISGSLEGFVARMNQRAAELGMQNTKFLDCCGLNDEAYSCAYDVAVMSRALMQHEAIQDYTTIWMDTLRNGASQLVNTNKLIRHYSGATGLKTGTTATAGHNLAATATRNGLSLVAVILGCQTTNERFGGARKLLDYGFANYTTYQPAVTPQQLSAVSVSHGLQETTRPALPELSPLLLKRGEESKVVCTVRLEEAVEAPVTKGQTIGEIQVVKNGEVLATYPLCAATAVERMTFFAAFARLFSLLAAPG